MDIKKPIRFQDSNKREKAVVFTDTSINGTTRFAITKNTENGKYVRGNLLYYNLDGTEIYTELSNIIFVDTKNKSFIVRRQENVDAEINPVNPEDREYILLYTDLGYEDEDEEFPLRWEAVTGRSTAYENIKCNIEVIDIDKSLVLVDTVAPKDAMTVRQFMSWIKNGNIIEDESFDINDYTGSEYV